MSKFFKVNVSAVIFNEDNRVLIQKRAEGEEVFPGLWGIPGGTLEMTDENLLSALSREVTEEVGIQIADCEVLKENVRAKELYGMLYIVYSAQYASGEATALDGTSEVRWVQREEIDDLIFTPTTKEVIATAYERRNSISSV